MLAAKHSETGKAKVDSPPEKAKVGEAKAIEPSINPVWQSLATHTAGSSAFGASGQTPSIQTKPSASRGAVVRSMSLGTPLKVGAPDDEYEQQADAVAQRVMRIPTDTMPAPLQTKSLKAPPLQRVCAACEAHADADQTPGIQTRRTAAMATTATGVSADIQRTVQAPSAGAPLSPALRSRIEPALGADLSGVRVHQDAAAQSASKGLNAKAFTHAQHIFLGTGQSASDPGLMAHEAAHVVQQGAASQALVQRRLEEPDQALPSAVPTGSALAIEGEDEASIPTWEQVQQEMAQNTAETRGDIGEPDLEEDTIEAGEEEAAPAPSAAGGDSATGEPSLTEDGEEVEEIEIPEFQSEQPGFCGDLVPPPPPLTEGGNEPAAPDQESFARRMLTFVGSSAAGLLSPLGAVPGLAQLRTAVAGGAMWAWRRLPVSVRAKAVDLALDASQRVWSGVALATVPFPANRWLSAAMIAFFARLRRMPNRLKVAIFEKVGSIALGDNLSFTLGYLKGLLRGFFVDGLIGIIQMIVDIICLIPQIGKFIDALGKLFGAFTFEMQNIVISFGIFRYLLDEALSNAITELKQFLSSPQRIVGLLHAIDRQGVAIGTAIGRGTAEAMIRFFRLSASSMGFAVGRFAGVAAFEALIIVLTWGGGAAVTIGKLFARLGAKLMAMAGRYILPIVRAMGFVLRILRSIVVDVSRFLSAGFRRAGGALRNLLDTVGNFFARLLRLCRRGTTHCKVSKKRGWFQRRRSARDLWRRERRRPGSRRCDKRYVPRLGGFLPHDRYVRRVTGTTRDYRISMQLGRRWTCTYDAFKRGQRLLVEGKTGYRWLDIPQVQQQFWFPFALARLEEQRFRCLSIATGCGPYRYEWWMKDNRAASYLHSRWGGVPPVIHRP